MWTVLGTFGAESQDFLQYKMVSMTPIQLFKATLNGSFWRLIEFFRERWVFCAKHHQRAPLEQLNLDLKMKKTGLL